MDSIIVKSFIPEFFLSFSIFLQLLFNVRIINNFKFNFPLIDKEIFIQILFIIFSLYTLFLNLKIEGFFSNFLFLNNEGITILKIIFVLINFFSFFIIFKGTLIQKLNFFEFFIFLLFSVLSSFLLLSSYDLLSAYLSLEMQALCFYILSSFKRNSALSTEAGLKYFISGAFISCIFLFGASILYGCLGTLDFNGIALLVSFPFQKEFENFKYFILLANLCIIFTLLFKISVVPFHFWSPDVYEGSPLSSTIIFSILPKIIIFTFLIKWIFLMLTSFFFIKYFFFILGILSVGLGTLFSLRQKKFKKLIIYSSIAQIGFPIAAIGSNCFDSYIYIYFFLITYVLTSIILWGNITLIQNSQKKLNFFFDKNSLSLFISFLSNSFSTNKIWSFTFLFIFFSISGIPPLLGFLSKIFIILSLIEGKQFITSIFLLLISIFSVFYYIRIIKTIFFETLIIKQNKNKFMQINFYDMRIEILIFSFFLFLLLFLFFYPSFLLLGCEYIILNFISINL